MARRHAEMGRPVSGRAVICSAAVAAVLGAVLSSSGATGATAAHDPAGSGATAVTALHEPAAPDAHASADATPRWQWPVVPPRVVQAYAAPPTRYEAGHRGIDLAAERGSVVVAPSDAVVHFSGVVVDRPVLTLDHGSGILSSYEPLVAEGLQAGDSVARGARLGVVGTGAHCSDVCLHVGVRIDGKYVSPLLFFDRVPRSVLLPLRGGAPASDQARG